jgi:hypothetical protein
MLQTLLAVVVHTFLLDPFDNAGIEKLHPLYPVIVAAHHVTHSPTSPGQLSHVSHGSTVPFPHLQSGHEYPFAHQFSLYIGSEVQLCPFA